MEEIIPLTKALIRFKSTSSNPVGIQQCAGFIEKYLNNLNIEYRRTDHHNPSILVLPQLRSNFSPLLLMSHMDVVDAPGELFEPFEKDNRIYGRGSLDDKYAVALSLVLLKNHLRRLELQGRGQKDLPFGILITGDEETGGFNGAKKVLKELKTDFCIVLDGGDVEKIVVKEKGVVKIKLVSQAGSAPDDGSRPDENAVEKLMADCEKLKTYFVTSSPAHPHRGIRIRGVHSKGSDHPVPASAEAFIDILYTENDNMEKLFVWMHRELHGTLVVESVTPLFPQGESPDLNLLMSISKKSRIGFEDGANDARFLSENGIKGIIYGANGDRSQHSLNEHVNVESICDLYGILDEFIKRSEALK